jgi:serine/threonine protein kinase
MAFQKGQVVQHFVIDSKIAEGAMGVVWKAWDKARNEFVAIKSIADDLVEDVNFQARFFREIRMQAKLDHPNIVPVLEIFGYQNQFCMAMKLIEGESLSDLLQRSDGHRLKLKEILPIAKDILAALDYAHQNRTIHRDVKPSNILIDRSGRALLTDFGIAIVVGENRRTRAGVPIGTPHYMSPEQIVSPQNIDHRSDVYSFGCVLYEMATGRPPFANHRAGVDTASDFRIRDAHTLEPPIPPRDLVHNLSLDFDQVVMWALKKNPDDRIAGCARFSNLLSKPKQTNSARFKVGFEIWEVVLRLIVLIGTVIGIASAGMYVVHAFKS